MKKMLKSVLSVIICLALLLVPMTVMAEEGVDYIVNYEMYLTEGTNTYTVDATVPYTVYILYPSEVGDYTITSDDCVMGIVSYMDMWVQFEPTEENVNLNTVEWRCTDINQSIMVGIKSSESEVAINVSRGDSSDKEELEWQVYENTADFDALMIPSLEEISAFKNVNYKDDVIDDAILGDDGYYHLNEKTGPILFANLNSSAMSLYTISSNGRLSAIYYDENGAVLEMIDFTPAFNEYVATLPTDAANTITSYYYPLTADLIEMFKQLGATREWYGGEAAWVYASEDAWLYACYYDENLTNTDDNDNDDNDDTDVEEILMGDVENDGQVNGKDAALLIQYVNGWNVGIDESLADVYADGKINIKDYITLVRYLNGWDVELG